MVDRYPALFIPSGGLSGYANSTVLRAKLEAYAANGGAIVAFAQQYGREYAVLPVEGRLTAYGYAEDINCQRDSSAIATYAPMFLGQSKEVLSLNVDGYFTDYPHDATILLTRIINGQPSMLAYPYGEGWVLATTTYADMAYYMSQGTGDERRFVHDLAEWALHPTLEIDQYGDTDVVTIPITLTNDTIVPVIAESITIRDPGGSLRVGTGLTLTLAAGESQSVTFAIPLTVTAALGTPNGVWQVNYTLYDEQGLAVQATSDAYRFAVTEFTAGEDGGYTYQGAPYGFSITSEDEDYAYGETATFTFHVFNHTDQARDFRVSYGLDHWWDWGGFWQMIFGWPTSHCDLTVAPHDEGTCQWQRVVDSSHRVHAFLETGGERVASAERGYWLLLPEVEQELRTDKVQYAPGDVVTLTLSTTNLREEPYEASTTLTVRDRHNAVVFSDVLTTSVPACLPTDCPTVERIVILPTDLPYGTYRASTETRIERWSAGSASIHFTLPILQLHIKDHLPASLEPDSSFSLTVTNPEAVTSPANTLSLTLTNPAGQAVWAETRVLGDLAPGQVVTPTFALYLEGLK